MTEIAVGIDLGTSNSCVAISRNGKVEVLPNAYGESITASVVAFGEDGQVSVGNAARANVIHDPVNTISSSKRLIGRYFFSEEVKKARAVCSYEIVEGPNHSARIRARGRDYALPELSAMILREMKSVAEARLGVPVTRAVITVPAYFNDNQRQATRDAGRIAGLDVLRILNEPTAAALAYGFGRGLSQRVAIYDLGGGTFDISVLEIGQDVFEVLSTCGDTFLGGDDFDDRLIDLLADEFLAREGINLRADPFALEKLKVAAESAKRALSVDDEVEIRIPDVLVGPDGVSRSLQRTLSAQEYAGIVMDLVVRTFKVCDEALQQANLTARELAGVILVGGPTRLPLIRQAVRDYFQQDPKTDVNPDEVVALGAAIHAASLVQAESKAFLLDVTPLSLRVGVAGGLAEPIIDRNTPVPIEQTRTFTTFQDGQESVNIRVYQGESRQAADNALLGQFEFAGFRKARRGEVRIAVTFAIDGDGIVQVTARDVESGQQASTRITLSSGLSEDDLREILSRDPEPSAAGAPAADLASALPATPAIAAAAEPVALPPPPVAAAIVAPAPRIETPQAPVVANAAAVVAAVVAAAAPPAPLAQEQAVLLPEDDLDVLPDDLPDLGAEAMPAIVPDDLPAPVAQATPLDPDRVRNIEPVPPLPSEVEDSPEDEGGALELTAGLAPPAIHRDEPHPEAIDIGDIFGDPDDALPLEPAPDPFDRAGGELSPAPDLETSGLDLELDGEL